MSVGNFTVGEEFGQLVQILRTMQSSTDNKQRKTAEQQYNNAKKQPDFLVQALVQIISTGELDQRDYAAILLRRLFVPDPSLDDAIVFSNATETVKNAVTQTLLQCFQSEEHEKPRRHIGNALVTLADQHVCAADSEGKRSENNWPEFFQVVCRMCECENIAQKTCAMEVLTELLPIYPEMIKKVQKQMHTLLEQSFGHADSKVRKTAVLLVLGMVMNFKAKEWKPLQPCLPVIIRVLENLARLHGMQNEEAAPAGEYLTECLEAMTETCEYEAIFFKPDISGLAELLVQIIAAKDKLDSTPRSAALEFFITLAEQKPKMCMTQCPDFGSYLIKAAMDCQMEIEDTDGSDWAAVMDDEEDDDDDELFKLGGEVIDRAISALSMKKIGSSYFQAIGMYVQNSEDWRSPMSALSAISEGVEYVEKDAHLDELMDLCLKHTTHAHMRVRAQSWHALSRIFADHREVTDRWHKQYMEATLRGLDDPVLRVQTKNLGAFLYFGEALDSVIMESYAKHLLEKLVEKIKSCSHRGVIEECITSIAVVAGSIEKEFAPFYEAIMPMLKDFIKNSKDEKETRLRGKAFECMSLFGVAVGKDRFKNDVTECMENMLQQGSQSKGFEKKNAEILTDYLKDAIERVAGVMEEDMGPFLPALLFGGGHGSGLMQVLDLQHAANSQKASAGGDDEDEDEMVTLQNGSKVRSAYFKEMADAAETVCCLVQNSKKNFLPHVPQVCEGLTRLFSIEDKSIRVSLEGDDVLAKCSEVWAAITCIVATSDGASCKKLLEEYNRINLKWLNEASDAEEIAAVAKGVAEVLSSCCPATAMTDAKKAEYADVTMYLDPARLMELFQLCEVKLAECFKNREDNLLKEHEWREGAETDDVEGERNQLDDLDENHEANVAISQIIGALMQLNPNFFAEQLLGKVDNVIRKCLDITTISKKLASKDRETIISKNKILAYFIACDVCEHLGEKGANSWTGFLEQLFTDLQNVDYEVRHAASYFVYLAAMVPGFERFSGEALKRLLQVLRDPAEYGKAAQNKYASCDDIKLAEDNTIAAVFNLLAYSPQLSAQHSAVWDELILPKLPLKTDTEVGAQAILKLLDMFQAERADILGPNNSRVPNICGAFAEAYKASDNEDMDMKVKTVFTKFPTSFFESTLKPAFKDTQWKKLEKLMKDPVAGA